MGRVPEQSQPQRACGVPCRGQDYAGRSRRIRLMAHMVLLLSMAAVPAFGQSTGSYNPWYSTTPARSPSRPASTPWTTMSSSSSSSSTKPPVVAAPRSSTPAPVSSRSNSSTLSTATAPAPSAKLPASPAPAVKAPRPKPRGPVTWTRPVSEAAAVALISKPGNLFQYQLAQPFDINKHVIPGVRIYIIDAFINSAATISAMRAAGLLPVCYFSAGISASWLTDRSNLTRADFGQTVSGNDIQRFLDIRRPSVRNWITNRINVCRAKGFVGVQLGDTDLHNQATGLQITALDMRSYLAWLSAQVKRQGLGVGLTNTLTLLDTAVARLFDWAVNSNCFQYLLQDGRPECVLYAPFKAAGKAVYQIEFESFQNEEAFQKKVCGAAQTTYGITSILKDASLGFEPWASCSTWATVAPPAKAITLPATTSTSPARTSTVPARTGNN